MSKGIFAGKKQCKECFVLNTINNEKCWNCGIGFPEPKEKK